MLYKFSIGLYIAMSIASICVFYNFSDYYYIIVPTISLFVIALLNRDPDRYLYKSLIINIVMWIVLYVYILNMILKNMRAHNKQI